MLAINYESHPTILVSCFSPMAEALYGFKDTYPKYAVTPENPTYATLLILMFVAIPGKIRS